MSHTSSYMLPENAIVVKTGDTVRKKGYKKATSIKKGDRIKILVETPEDGEFHKVVTVAKTRITWDGQDCVEFEFDGCSYDTEVSIPVNWLYKMENRL